MYKYLNINEIVRMRIINEKYNENNENAIK
jgi:DNA-directed RNA polymerase subunit E'/Rpb7